MTPPPQCDETTQFSCRSNTGSYRQSCIDLEKVCDFRYDCTDKSDESGCSRITLCCRIVAKYWCWIFQFLADGNCDFEDPELCGWTSESGNSRSSYTWQSGTGSDIQPDEQGSRPTTDHTHLSPDSSYMYADSSYGVNGDFTRLRSHDISKSGPQCRMQFYVWMTQVTHGTLLVFISDGISQIEEIWMKSGKLGDNWILAEAFIGSRTNFQVRLTILSAKEIV